MGMKRMSSILEQAISSFQESEFESIFEAKKPKKIKKITVAGAKRALAKERFKDKPDKPGWAESVEYRCADVSPGIKICEVKTELEGRKRPMMEYYLSTFMDYTGKFFPGKRHGSLKIAVSVANRDWLEDAAEAFMAWEH